MDLVANGSIALWTSDLERVKDNWGRGSVDGHYRDDRRTTACVDQDHTGAIRVQIENQSIVKDVWGVDMVKEQPYWED